MLGELIATEGVREVAVRRSTMLVMALHGGVERATYPLARAISDGLDASLYAVVQPGDFFWHVPSTKYDPAESAALRSLLDHAELAVSLHGFGRRGLEDAVLVGGSNRTVAERVARSLRRSAIRAIDDISAIPRGLRGLHRDNPVNLPRAGGVQLELGGGVRRRPKTGAIVDAVVAALEPLNVEASNESLRGGG